MTDFTLLLRNLNRPRLLVHAARHGLSDYNRSRDLRRISGHSEKTHREPLILSLLEQERQIEETRKDKSATYSIARHIELLVALMAEFRLTPKASV